MPTDDDFRRPLIAIHHQLDRLMYAVDDNDISDDKRKFLQSIEDRIRGELDTIGVLVNFDLRDAN